MQCWQIRPPTPVLSSIADFFIRHGVALMGPGDAGPWSRDVYRHDYAGDNRIKKFAADMADGDAILLRTGPAQIRAVGLVVGPYAYESRFDDVHGFDLQHCRRVRWCKLPQDYQLGGSAFTKGRFSRVQESQVREYVSRFLASPPTHWRQAPLPGLPLEEPPWDGVPPTIAGITAQAQDLSPQLEDRRNFGEAPSEAELVCHFVVPLLRALGWPPELIAVEWRDVDVAAFRKLPRASENCQLLIEAKRPGADVEVALEQVRGYAQELGIRSDVIITDGIRYRMFAGAGYLEPVAYANLNRLRPSAADLLERMKRI